MAVMSGAVWRPLPQGFGTRMDRYDLVVIHTCVGSLTGTDGYFRSGKTSSNSHFGTGGYGEIWQWGDSAFRSAANGAGNHRSITIENADMGPGFPAWNTSDGNAVPAFTPQQLEAVARICAWAHTTHGVPLVAADTSRPGARGIGFHRLGINNWRVPDGELWSSSTGKVCPGPSRIAQIPQIITRARQIVGGVPAVEDFPVFSQWSTEEKNEFGNWLKRWVLQEELRTSSARIIAQAVLSEPVPAANRTNPDGTPNPDARATLAGLVGWNDAHLDVTRALIAAGGVDVEALRSILIQAVHEGMAAGKDATADEIVDRLAARLAG